MIRSLAATACALIVSASLAHGAEYFVYKDHLGNVVLSNLPPPPAAEIIRAYQLDEVSDEEVRRATEREQRFWQEVAARRLVEANEKLAESNLRLADALRARALGQDSGVVIQSAQTIGVAPRRFHRQRADGSAKPHARPAGRFR